uniref:PHD finger protein 7 n=1 Tax=Gopherus evgoodei TaxID=1825980 RepID=A0A8C4Y872_9SAUR
MCRDTEVGHGPLAPSPPASTDPPKGYGGDLGNCGLFCSPCHSFQTCCVCGCKGASIACQGRKCTKNFHFPCGSEKGCIYQFFGEFKSFCWKHRPVQRVRRRQQQAETICIVCLESMPGKPSYSAMVCPACKHAWFHRDCIQGHALRAALYHFRCPRCRDMGTFQREMFRMGIKIPDRDAAWEEDGAFSDQYHRHSHCDASCCLYVGGREQFADNGPWQLLLCNSCGSQGTHRRCSSLGATKGTWECEDCAEPTGAGKGLWNGRTCWALGLSGGSSGLMTVAATLAGHWGGEGTMLVGPGPKPIAAEGCQSLAFGSGPARFLAGFWILRAKSWASPEGWAEPPNLWGAL